MRSIQELEGLSKEQMTSEENEYKEVVIDRIISIVLHLGYKDPEGTWSYSKTDRLLVYQEDIMMLCQYGAGFTLARADDVRRAMGKKVMELMLSFKDEFISGWQSHIGIFGEEIWEKMVDYAKYCFNKSHAVCYTLISAETAELCLPENRVEFMLHNYNYGKPDKKVAAINHLLESANLRFPSYKKPFEGIKIIGKNDIVEIKDMYEDFDEEKVDEMRSKEYESFADLFLADLPPSMKFKLISRGVYDQFTLDIKGLAMLNKALGKNAREIDEIPDSAFESKDLSGTIKLLKLQGLFEYVVDTPDRYEIMPKKSPRARKDPDLIIIHKGYNIGSWGNECTMYRTQQLKKQFSIIKKNGLSQYVDRVSELRDIGDKINDVIKKVKINNPNMRINNKNLQLILKKIPKINERFENLKDQIENTVITGYVADKVVLKNGSCCVSFNFLDDYTPIKFYTRDAMTISNIEKGSIIDFRILINDTIWRGDFKVFTSIALA